MELTFERAGRCAPARRPRVPPLLCRSAVALAAVCSLLAAAPAVLATVFPGISINGAVGAARANVVIDTFAIKRGAGVRCSDFTASANWAAIAHLVEPLEIAPVTLTTGAPGCAIVAAFLEFLKAGVFHPRIEVNETGALPSKDTIIDTARVAPSELVPAITLLRRARDAEQVQAVPPAHLAPQLRTARARLTRAQLMLARAATAISVAAGLGEIPQGPGRALAQIRTAEQANRHAIGTLAALAARPPAAAKTAAELRRASLELASARRAEQAVLRVLLALPH